MNDTTNFQSPINPDPRRRLKKVKRPIKRIVPQGENVPASPNIPNENFSKPNLNDVDAFNLDAYLDNSNLPTVSDANFLNNQQNFQNDEMPRFISDDDIAPEQNPGFLSSFQNSNFVAKKVAIAIGIGAFVIGILFSKIFLGEQKVVRDGLQGVVVNSEVPRGRARCGLAEKTQGCVLYIMNPQRQELNASDFYDLASQLTGRQRFIIETGNMRYSNRKIKPGEIAQFNIPPLQ